MYKPGVVKISEEKERELWYIPWFCGAKPLLRLSSQQG